MKVLGIIPSRGSGDDWPWVNARKLGGYPLVVHSILSARQSRHLGRVLVSTEDPGIAAIAREYGADVPFLRDPRHARPGSMLNEAMIEILDYLKRHEGYEPEALALLESDAPFRTPQLIDAAVERFLQGDVDSVVALTPEYDQFWRKDGERIVEVLARRTRKEGLEPLLRETGVVRVIRTATLTCERYLGRRVGHVLADPRSSFTIRTIDDFRMAERLLQPYRVLFRADGSRTIGMGHLYSVLRVAECLVKQEPQTEVLVLIGSRHAEGATLVAERGFPVEVCPSEDLTACMRRLDRFGPDLVVNDLMVVPKDYMEQLRLSGYRVVNIVDSLADVEEGPPPDVLINFSHEAHVPCGYEYFCGTSYATLDPSLSGQQVGGQRTLRTPPTVIVTMGGSDPENLSAKCLEALDAMPESLAVTLVIGPAFMHEAAVIQFIQCARKPVLVQKAVPDMARLYAEADIGLAAGGRTLYELSAMGVPAIVLSQNQREQERVEHFSHFGSVISLGLGREVVPSQIQMAVRRLLEDRDLLRRMQEAGSRLVDGNGVQRIVGIIRQAMLQRQAI